jgi:hypothetical protein
VSVASTLTIAQVEALLKLKDEFAAPLRKAEENLARFQAPEPSPTGHRPRQE